MESYRPLLIAALVLTEVGLWQWRMVIAARGQRGRAMLLGAVGAVLQITAISQVVTNPHDPTSVVAYAAGVGFGVLVGLIAGDRISPGPLGVTVITSAPGLAGQLWERGWPATAHSGEGENGPVEVLFLAIARRDEDRLRRDVDRLAPGSFWSSKELRDFQVDDALSRSAAKRVSAS